MRIVLDTNVLISAFIAQGVCSDLFESCIQHHELITSDFIINEFQEKLKNKFKFSQKDVNASIRLLLSVMEMVEPVKLNTTVCRDHEDDNILATAVTGNCSCIITGDKDLLCIRHFKSIDIMSPKDFIKYETSKGKM